MGRNKYDMMFRTLRTAIAGTCSLITIKLFNLSNFWNIALFFITFAIVSASYDAYINFHIKQWSRKKTNIAKIVSWIIFILLVVILSYLNIPQDIYLY